VRSSEGAIVWREEFAPEIGKWEQGFSVLTVTREEKAACALATGTKCHRALTTDPRRPERKSTSCVTPGPDSESIYHTQRFSQLNPLVRTSRMDRRLSGKRGLSAKMSRGVAADGG
jgi:hypothetical protein